MAECELDEQKKKKKEQQQQPISQKSVYLALFVCMNVGGNNCVFIIAPTGNKLPTAIYIVSFVRRFSLALNYFQLEISCIFKYGWND